MSGLETNLKSTRPRPGYYETKTETASKSPRPKPRPVSRPSSLVSISYFQSGESGHSLKEKKSS